MDARFYCSARAIPSLFFFPRSFVAFGATPRLRPFSSSRSEKKSERASERERERERSKDSFRNRSLIKEKKKFRTRGENIVEDNAIDGCIPRCVFLCAFFLSLSSFSRLQRSLNPSRPRRAWRDSCSKYSLRHSRTKKVETRTENRVWSSTVNERR